MKIRQMRIIKNNSMSLLIKSKNTKILVIQFEFNLNC